jgi:hypothetical protein
VKASEQIIENKKESTLNCDCYGLQWHQILDDMSCACAMALVQTFFGLVLCAGAPNNSRNRSRHSVPEESEDREVP